MQFLSWKEIAARRGVSVSTEKRLHKTDPRHPKKTRLSPGRVGFAKEEADEYDRLLMAEQSEAAEVAADISQPTDSTSAQIRQDQPVRLGEVTEQTVNRLSKERMRS